MTKILLAGIAVLDFVFQVDAFPDAPRKYRARDATIVGGGNAANSSVAVSRLDATAILAARLGKDQVADMILAELGKNAIDCSLVQCFEGRRSSFSSILIDDTGERQIVNYRDVGLTMDADWLETSLPVSFNAAMGETRWPEGARVAMEAARQRGLPGIMDAEEPVGDCLPAMEAASHTAFSAQGAEDFTGQSDPEAAALAADKELPGKVIVTDGERGVVSIRDGKPVWHKSFPISPVDTLGAGDVWHGAFAVALAEGQNEDEAIRFASAAAAIKCTRFGGREGAPTRNEVNQFLRENP